MIHSFPYTPDCLALSTWVAAEDGDAEALALLAAEAKSRQLAAAAQAGGAAGAAAAAAVAAAGKPGAPAGAGGPRPALPAGLAPGAVFTLPDQPGGLAPALHSVLWPCACTASSCAPVFQHPEPEGAPVLAAQPG